MLVNLSLSDEATLYSLRDALVGVAIATLHISASDSSLCRSMNRVGGRLVRLIEIAYCATVAHHKIFEAPLIAQYGLQQALATTARVVVKTLIGTHHLAHLRILNKSLESRHICLPHIAWRHISKVCRVACIFWSAVYGIVFCTSPQLTIFCCLRTLQALYNLHTHDAGQVWVLTIGLLSPAPTRVAKNINIRSPDRKAVELLVLTLLVIHAVVILCAEFCTRNIEALIKQIRIERCRHCHRFWEHCHITHVGCAMQSLAPPEEFLYSQARDSRTLVEHQFCLLFKSKLRTEVNSPFVGAEVRIFILRL